MTNSSGEPWPPGLLQKLNLEWDFLEKQNLDAYPLGGGNQTLCELQNMVSRSCVQCVKSTHFVLFSRKIVKIR